MKKSFFPKVVRPTFYNIVLYKPVKTLLLRAKYDVTLYRSISFAAIQNKSYDK